jgi:hypothetical protein
MSVTPAQVKVMQIVRLKPTVAKLPAVISAKDFAALDFCMHTSRRVPMLNGSVPQICFYQ